MGVNPDNVPFDDNEEEEEEAGESCSHLTCHWHVEPDLSQGCKVFPML